MKDYFVFKEVNKDKWIINPIYDNFSSNKICGSYNLIACRISGLNWVQWLKCCKQNGAEIYGKGSLYPVVYWKSPNKSFLNKLNERANKIAEFFDWKEIKL